MGHRDKPHNSFVMVEDVWGSVSWAFPNNRNAINTNQDNFNHLVDKCSVALVTWKYRKQVEFRDVTRWQKVNYFYTKKRTKAQSFTFITLVV